ncbi:MAG: hypothetical protein H8E55_60140 [Pelagibacterales bacterium]|jgi:hypothetical protein|nr:hypothetical protein [Pelagibacterales bacterium]
MIDKVKVVERLKEISDNMEVSDSNEEFEVVLVEVLDNLISHLTTDGEVEIEN